MKDKINLLPCPFCGGEAEIHKCHVSFSNPNYKGYAVRVRCKNCWAYSPFKRGKMLEGAFKEGYEKEAIAAWNERV